MSQLSCSDFSGGITISLTFLVLGNVSCWCFSLVHFSLSPFFPLGFSLLLFDSSLSFFSVPAMSRVTSVCSPSGRPCTGIFPVATVPPGCGSPLAAAQGCSCSMGPSGMSTHWHRCSLPLPLGVWLPKPELRMISVQGIWSSWLLQSRVLCFPIENQFAITKIKEENELHVIWSIRNKVPEICLKQTNIQKSLGLVFARTCAIGMWISSPPPQAPFPIQTWPQASIPSTQQPPVSFLTGLGGAREEQIALDKSVCPWGCSWAAQTGSGLVFALPWGCCAPSESVPSVCPLLYSLH